MGRPKLVVVPPVTPHLYNLIYSPYSGVVRIRGKKIDISSNEILDVLFTEKGKDIAKYIYSELGIPNSKKYKKDLGKFNLGKRIKKSCKAGDKKMEWAEYIRRNELMTDEIEVYEEAAKLYESSGLFSKAAQAMYEAGYCEECSRTQWWGGTYPPKSKEKISKKREAAYNKLSKLLQAYEILKEEDAI